MAYKVFWADNHGVHCATVATYFVAVSVAIAINHTHSNTCGGVLCPNGRIEQEWTYFCSQSREFKRLNHALYSESECSTW